jgi:hypothetical protein
VNFNVTYDNARTLSSFGVFYNLVGETLLTGASRGDEATPNVFSNPVDLLNVTFSQRFKKWPGFAIGLKAKNILQADLISNYRNPAGDEVLKRQRESAMRISLSLSWSF